MAPCQKTSLLLYYLVLRSPHHPLYPTMSKSKPSSMALMFPAMIQWHGYCNYSCPLAATSLWWIGWGLCWRNLFNYVNRLRKKLISKLINLILVFYPRPNWSSPKRWYCASPTTPLVKPLLLYLLRWACMFLVGCWCETCGGRIRPRCVLFLLFFLSLTSTAQTIRQRPTPASLPS